VWKRLKGLIKHKVARSYTLCKCGCICPILNA
jgi:hypothetical protein